MGAVTTWSTAVSGRKSLIESPYLLDAVANVAALNALVVTGLNDGARVWVASHRDFFELKTMAGSATGVLIYASATAGRLWLRLLEPSPSWANQATFYIDPTLGNDEYDGTVATFTSGLVGPVKTFNELINRLGRKYHCNNPDKAVSPGSSFVQTINILGNCAEVVIWDVTTDYNAKIYVKGTISAAVFTGTISAKTDMAAATNTPTAVTSTWTPATELGRLCKTTISAVEYNAYVIKDNTGGSARLTPWTQYDPLVSSTSATLGNATVSAAITTHTFTAKIAVLAIRCFNVGFGITFEDIDFTDSFTTGPIGSALVFRRCLFTTSSLRCGHGQTVLNNCLLNTTSSNITGNDAPSYLALVSGGARGAMIVQPRFAEVNVSQAFTFQGASCTVANGLFRVNTNGCAFFDCGGDALVLQAGSTLRTTGPLFGSGNAGYGVRFHGSTQGLVDNGVTNTITGSSGDFCFGKASGLPATKTQARGYDTTTGLEGTARTLSWANLILSYVGGGFAGSILDRDTNCRVTIN